MKALKLLLFLCIVFLSSPCWAVDYYVSQSGIGDGSAYATPDSIADFNANVFGALDGDEVFFIGTITTALNTPDGGADADNRVTLSSCEIQYGASADDPVSFQTDAANTDAIIIDVHFVDCYGLDVGNAGDHGYNITGDNVRIYQAQVVNWGQDGDNWRAGIYLDTSSSSIINGNMIYLTGAPAGNYWAGIRVGSSGTNHVIQNNVIGQNSYTANGIYTDDGGNAAVIKANIVTATSMGIYSSDSDNVLICYNEVHAAGNGIYLYAIDVDDLSFEVFNNTLYSTDVGSAYGMRGVDSAPENIDAIDARNNIIVGFNTYAMYIDGTITPTEDYNCLYDNTANLYYNDGAQAIGAHSITSDPQLYTLDGLIYKLQEGSPCIDNADNSVWSGTPNVSDIVGFSITDGVGNIDAYGGTVDIGAAEYGYPSTLEIKIQ